MAPIPAMKPRALVACPCDNVMPTILCHGTCRNWLHKDVFAGSYKRTAASHAQASGAGVFRAERRLPEPGGPSPPAPVCCSPVAAGVLIAEHASTARRARLDPGVPARVSVPSEHEISRHPWGV